MAYKYRTFKSIYIFCSQPIRRVFNYYYQIDGLLSTSLYVYNYILVFFYTLLPFCIILLFRLYQLSLKKKAVHLVFIVISTKHTAQTLWPGATFESTTRHSFSVSLSLPKRSLLSAPTMHEMPWDHK